jgi:hypothetical protein
VWTPKIFSKLFPLARVEIPISPLAGHSLLIKSPRWSKEAEADGCHAVFATETLGFTPELFSRFGEEIFLGGLNSTTIPLPEVATGSKVDPEAADRLKSVAKQMLGLSGAEDDLEILRSSLVVGPQLKYCGPVRTDCRSVFARLLRLEVRSLVKYLLHSLVGTLARAMQRKGLECS